MKLSPMKTLSPNNLGGNGLVETCPRVSVKELLRISRAQIKELVLGSQIDAFGAQIKLATSKTNYGGTRYWFVCPICQRRAGVLFKNANAVGCRLCLGLEYRRRRYKGMV